MATLHVRNVPDALYAQLHQMAAANSQSLAAEVVGLLTRAVEEQSRRANQKAVLDGLRRRRFTPPAEAPDSTSMLREDRDR